MILTQRTQVWNLTTGVERLPNLGAAVVSPLSERFFREFDAGQTA